MDDTMKTYGNLELPEGTPERPRLTLAVFAYNQEKYIREAVQGAISQTYSPLEIILSDDCSSDRTFEIMLDIAQHYSGKHKICVRRSKKNLGTYNHVIEVARQSSGTYFVVNAGDDVSYDCRTTEIVACFLTSNATAVGSRYDTLNEDSAIVERGLLFPPSKGAQIVFGRSSMARKADGIVKSVPGFCAAYRTDFLQTLSFSPGKLLIEDGTLNGIMNCRGDEISIIDQSLIMYRIHSGSLTVRNAASTPEEIQRREQRISRMSESILLMISQIEAECSRSGVPIEESVKEGFERGKRYATITCEFWSKSPVRRLVHLLKCRSREDFLFCLPRSFGFTTFLIAKRLYSGASSILIRN